MSATNQAADSGVNADQVLAEENATAANLGNGIPAPNSNAESRTDADMKKKLKADNEQRAEQARIMIDLNEVILNWAEGVCSVKKGILKGIDFKKLEKRVNLDNVKTRTEQCQHTRVASSRNHDTNAHAHASGNIQTRDANDDMKVVYKSTFDNNTSEKQNHTFKATRETTSTLTSSISDGYQTTVNLGLEISLPGDVAKVSTGFSESVTVQTTESSTQGEKVAWFIDTMINVPAFTRTTAIVHIEEATYESTFIAIVKTWGMVEVVLTDPKSGKQVRHIVQDITTILDKQKNATAGGSFKYPKLQQAVKIDAANNCARWIIKGKTKLQYGLKQNVVLHQEDLPGKAAHQRTQCGDKS